MKTNGKGVFSPFYNVYNTVLNKTLEMIKDDFRTFLPKFGEIDIRKILLYTNHC